MDKLTCDLIAEIITNDESADELSDYYESNSDESDCEDLAQEIRKHLVSKLTKNNGSSTIVSSNSVSDVSFTQTNVLDKQKCSEIIDNSDTLGFVYNDCPDRDDPYSYSSSPEISISNDIDLNSFDIENMAVVFDDNYVVYPHTSTPNTNTNYSTTQNNNSDNFYFDINSDCPNIEQNSVISNTEPEISIKKRKMPVSTKKQIPNKNTRLSDSTLFSGLWNFNKNMLPQYCPNNLNFDSSHSGVNNDLINDVPSENLELYIFKHIFDEDLVQHIVEETNKFYHFLVNNTVLSKHSKLGKWKDTNLNEMYIFFALMLLMPHVKKNNIKDYWSTSVLLSTPIFGKIMTQDRFLLLLRVLHFNDNRNQIPGDRLFKIKTIVESLRKKFKSTYQPHQKVCVDESIVEWKGQLQFKQYIPSKRHRFGIKLFVLCDCKSGFVLDFLIYTGDNTHITINETLKLYGSVISTLMEPYVNKGHIIYMDNWYSSPTLFEYLLKKRYRGMWYG